MRAIDYPYKLLEGSFLEEKIPGPKNHRGALFELFLRHPINFFLKGVNFAAASPEFVVFFPSGLVL
jgi:hypothetical protein